NDAPLYLCRASPRGAGSVRLQLLPLCTTEFQVKNSDLVVHCGVSFISLEVNLCTAEWAGFDPSGLALNGERNNSQCLGSIDDTVDPPVIRYELPINNSQNNPCRQSLQRQGSIQAVVITGYIDTPSSAAGIISYATDLYYHFSCRYPLEYLINNTQIVASSVSVATKDNNGTFIDTLSMSVFNTSSYNNPLVVPPPGLDLRTKVYVEVKAVNLTGKCMTENRTMVIYNGLSKFARFSFEAFRFVEHRNQEKSTIYLHCILRLCEPNKCQELLNSCNSTKVRKRRASEPFGTQAKESATVSLGPLYTAALKAEASTPSAYGGSEPQTREGMNVAGVVAGIIFATGGALVLVMAGWFVLKKFFWAGGLPRAFH
ncbi:hypothetical protein DNTS_017990, partial [Danionella cerebrum]